MSKMSKAIAALGVVAGLGVAALPLSSYAKTGVTATPVSVTAQAIVGDSISIAVEDGKETVTINNVTAGKDIASNSADITVLTNNLAGYNVTIEDADGVPAMKNTDSSVTQTIPARVPAKGQAGWGFKASTEAPNVDVSASTNYRALSGTDPMIIATKSAASANTGDVITLTFGVTVNNTIPAGTYQNEVTLTATTL